MALFFFLVGLEIKRELLTGNLATWPQRILPGAAAVGGMAVPALLFVFVNRNHPEYLTGWAIPAATDIAFALGIIALAGSRVPVSLKIFLTALAILDDLGAILVIALFYTHNIAVTFIVLAAILVAALITFNRCGVTRLWPYVLTGLLLWLCVYQSALHATLAGVIVALTIPIKRSVTLERSLHPWVAFGVIPIFAFFNAGVSLAGINVQAMLHPLTLGIFVGLFVGKQLGIGAILLAAIRLFKVPRPQGATNLQLYAVTLLCGIGFTMSLFIGNLAFPQAHMQEIRLGILAASLVSAVLGLSLLLLSRPAHK
ncbi:MAG: Na+/H+ antiporter NhaA [Alphaproteobacteria bacterium]|nr:MAG: Na+/H+ antiporter NhaA [Alphaproteobacteria bacterium]